MMRKKPERMAWLVVYGAFIVFLLLCAMIPLSVQYYLQHATTPQAATLEVISGTVRVLERGAAAPIGVTAGSVQLSEGSTIETDENSKGFLTFFDHSTVTLYTGTQVRLHEMHIAMFPWGIEPDTIVIEQTRGRIRVSPAQQIPQSNPNARTRTFQVITPQSVTDLTEGSYAVEVLADGATTQVATRYGVATVSAQERSVPVGPRQRTVVRRDEPPLPAMPAALDLVVNGDFKDPLTRGWENLRNAPSSAGAVPGAFLVVPLEDRLTLHIARKNAGTSSSDTGIVQALNKDVSDYSSLRLAADIRLHNQSLSGGGTLSSEYPLILRLKYRDVYGSEAEWVHGFYYQNTTNNPTLNGEQITQDVWYPFESANLFEIQPRPFFITSLQIYASGWDYDSYVTGIRLIVE